MMSQRMNSNRNFLSVQSNIVCPGIKTKPAKLAFISWTNKGASLYLMSKFITSSCLQYFQQPLGSAGMCSPYPRFLYYKYFLGEIRNTREGSGSCPYFLPGPNWNYN